MRADGAGVAKLITVREAASEANWTCGKRHCRCKVCRNGHVRMLRLLEKKNDEVHGTILVRRGSEAKPRWLVSLDALRRALPHLAKCEAPAAEADLEVAVLRQAELLRLAHKNIGDLRRELADARRDQAETGAAVADLVEAVQRLKNILLRKGAA